MDDTELTQIHILDFGNFTPKNFCKNTLECYKENPESWIDFEGTGLPEDKFEEYESTTRKNFNK